jgi:RNA polymerase sigma factor (sigma-70 family)
MKMEKKTLYSRDDEEFANDVEGNIVGNGSDDLNNSEDIEEINDGMSEAEVAAMELKKDDIAKLQHRTNQLFELIAFDPDNKQIYSNEIVEINIRLVPHVLRKYRPFTDDEFQLGCLGLIIAARTFDPSRNVPFASYACFCIERELHKSHRHQSKQFEFMMGAELGSLDEIMRLPNGDEVNKYETVADVKSEEEILQLIDEYSLDTIFDKVIYPSIDKVATSTKGQQTKVDFEKWRELELRYIFEMSQENSQKARFSLSAMSKMLGISTQNAKVRHQRVLSVMREKCIELGYHI